MYNLDQTIRFVHFLDVWSIPNHFPAKTSIDVEILIDEI